MVYRRALFAASEPYIQSQAEAIPRYVANYIGHGRSGDATAPPERTFVSGWGTSALRRSAFLIGHDPVIDRAIRPIKPCLLHAHFGPDAMFAMATARRFGLPLVATFHGYDATRPDQFQTGPGGRLWLRRRQALFEQAALLIAASDFVRERLLALGAPPHKVVRHYIGVDTAMFAPPPPPGERHPGEVLFVGRLSAAKGIIDLLTAMTAVRAAIPTATLTIIGDGPLRDEAQRMNRELGLGAAFLGARPSADVRDAMRRASVLCVPSKVSAEGQREGLGLVFAEAQACGLAVVSCRSGGVTEVVREGEGGLLVDEGDIAGIASAAVSCLGDQTLAGRLGAAGRRHVVEHFDLARQSALLADLYDTVVDLYDTVVDR